MKHSYYYTAFCLFLGTVIGFAALQMTADISISAPIFSKENIRSDFGIFSDKHFFLIHSALGFSFTCTFLIAIITLLRNAFRKK
ncbi:MAG: hypothetical protein V2I97_16950 [Desulfococcaceae bacterium]|nr:hypothetical protein [Desulfococcaceae bacterium]